jgi:hypothetical protein
LSAFCCGVQVQTDSTLKNAYKVHILRNLKENRNEKQKERKEEACFEE